MAGYLAEREQPANEPTNVLSGWIISLLTPNGLQRDVVIDKLLIDCSRDPLLRLTEEFKVMAEELLARKDEKRRGCIDVEPAQSETVHHER